MASRRGTVGTRGRAREPKGKELRPAPFPAKQRRNADAEPRSLQRDSSPSARPRSIHAPAAPPYAQCPAFILTGT